MSTESEVLCADCATRVKTLSNGTDVNNDQLMYPLYTSDVSLQQYCVLCYYYYVACHCDHCNTAAKRSAAAAVI
jgi:hypothetical protein